MRRGAAWMLLVASCGLASGEGERAPFPADGVGAFGDASPVEVCRGTARIVAPALATGATALCVPEGQTARECTSDDTCEGIERCICGRCIVAPCQGAGSCEGQEVCRGRRCTRACGADGDCAAGERCVSGGCARSCGSNGDCHHGESCDALDEVCTASLCGGGASCGGDRACIAVAEVAELGEPALLGDEPIVFVEVARGGETSLLRAHIEAPLRWRVDPEAPVLVLPGEAHVGAPSVLRRGARIELYAEVGDPARIVRAISTDEGQSFVVDQDPALAAAEPWEEGAVGSPSVFDFEGRTYLLYEGGDGRGIGLAEVTEQGATRASPNPVLAPADLEDPIFWRGVTQVGSPHAFVGGGAVRMTFTARGIEGRAAAGPDGALPPDPNDSIGLAATTDLQTFSLYPVGPMYTRLVNLRAYLGEREPAVRVSPSGAEMVFVSADASGEGVTGIYRAAGRGAAE